MIIQTFEATNFRNIRTASLSFSETYNLICGRNAQGKTNLLEAIHLFSLGRSFRTRKKEEMIAFDGEFAHIRLGGTSDAGVLFRADIGVERGAGIRASVGGKRLSGLAELIGLIPTVIFTPEDVTLASGPPAGRRTFLDYTAAQVSPEFLGDLNEFRKALKQRNSLLRAIAEGGGGGGDLEAWSEMFVEKGVAIVRGRREMLREVSRVAGELFGRILPGGESLGMEYACSFDPGGEGGEDALREALARAADGERRRGYTLVGPQYDDITVYCGDVELRRFGSQGRKRLSAIAMKLAQAAAIMGQREERPVVLLDDIFSELDPETAGKVREILSDSFQSFIASPRREDFAANPSGRRCFLVEGGSFSVVESYGWGAG